MQRITLFFIAFFSMNLLFSQATWDGANWVPGEPDANTAAIIAGPLLMSEMTPSPNHDLICKSLTINAGATITFDILYLKDHGEVEELNLLGAPL